MNIIAVIVTFNRPEKLEKSIRAIYAGKIVPHQVLVINNNSTDATDDLLVKLERQYSSLASLKTRQNMGGAGGFFVGLKAAYDREASHFWIMDDDAYCNVDALTQLVSAYQDLSKFEEVGFLCSRINWKDGQICQMNQPETAWDWMRNFRESLPVIKVTTCSFVSCFFSREVLEKVGLPIKEFFIWFDDHEFTYRISKRYPCYAVLNSIVVHDTPANESAYYALITDENVWKYRYGAANESWFRLWKKSPFHWLLFVTQKNRDMHQGHVTIRNRVLINFRILCGAFRRHRTWDVLDLSLEDLTRGTY